MYQSHKIVWALKIKDVVLQESGAVLIVPEDKDYSSFEMSFEYYEKHNPKAGGYYVQYSDGYTSWSPAEAFEEGYTRYRNTTRFEVLRKSYKYELVNFDDDGAEGQVIQFIEKVSGNDDKLITLYDGTTNEALIEVLIDRIGNLQEKFPCCENAIVITKLEESLMWLEKRTADRKKRNVEGKPLA